MDTKTICLLLAAVFAFAFPIALTVVWKKKSGTRFLPFGIGALVFFLFTVVLEGLFHYLVQQSAVISHFLSSSVAAYAIYGGMSAGLFEETGRFLAFKTVLKKLPEKQNAVSYGIGHGGMEVILLLGQTFILLSLAMLTNGANELSVYLPTAETLSVGFIGVSVLERVFAMALHVSLSVFVFIAARDPKKLWYYPLAVWLHAIVDAVAALYQAQLLPLWVTEAFVGVFCIGVLLAAIRVYRRAA